MATRADIKKRLLLTAELVALRSGFAIAPPCMVHINQFIDDGVNELGAKNALDDEIRIGLAEAGITALVDKMVENARNLSLTELHENTFFAAKMLLCPLWPFC